MLRVPEKTDYFIVLMLHLQNMVERKAPLNLFPSDYSLFDPH